MTTRVRAATVDAPWGAVHLAATARGVAAIELMALPDDFLAGLARRFGGSVMWASADPGPSNEDEDASIFTLLDDARRAVAAALISDPAAVALLAGLSLDLEDRPAWDRAVLGAVRDIPRGATRSYGDIARAVGRPGAARAVGGAVGRNPIALAIPCHRVIAGDGTLGGYGGGWWGDRERLLDLKQRLLQDEGIHVRRRASGPETGR